MYQQDVLIAVGRFAWRHQKGRKGGRQVPGIRYTHTASTERDQNEETEGVGSETWETPQRAMLREVRGVLLSCSYHQRPIHEATLKLAPQVWVTLGYDELHQLHTSSQLLSLCCSTTL